MTDRPALTLWTFKFVVRATDWGAAAKILKDTLGIEATRDASDREINGLYLISCFVDDTNLTKEFYENITDSKDIAIHSDTKSDSLYPKILKETQAVEEKLRWLLLHVSDAIEDYILLLGGSKSDIIEKRLLDPLTTRLSFEAMLGLLEIDQSWARDGVNDERMRFLINGSADFESFKTAYLERTTPKTVWESISELVLQHPVKWRTIEKKLKSIKTLRNKCAHFHTVTDDDLGQAQNLRTQIMRHLTKKKTYTSADLTAFTGLSRQLTETMKHINELQLEQMRPLAESALAAQKAMIESIKLDTSFLNSMKASQTITKQFFENSNVASIIKARTAAFSSLSKIDIPTINFSKSTLDSIAKAQESLRDFGISSQTDKEVPAENDTKLRDGDEMVSDDDRPPELSPDDTKGKKK